MKKIVSCFLRHRSHRNVPVIQRLLDPVSQKLLEMQAPVSECPSFKLCIINILGKSKPQVIDLIDCWAEFIQPK